MNEQNISRNELEIELLNYKQEIERLQTQGRKMQSETKDINILALIEELEQNRAIIDQYLKQIKIEEKHGWDKKATELAGMLNDINESCRKAMSIFY
jgi:hypothetical protein